MNINNFKTKTKENVKLIFYCLIVIYLLAGILYSINLGNNLRYPDEGEYYTLAGNLVSTFNYSLDGKTLTAFRPPGYPFLLGFLKMCGFNIILLRIANFIFLSTAILLVFKLFYKKGSEFGGLIFLSLIIFYPVIFYTAGTLYPQIFSSFLIILIIYLLFNRNHLSLSKSILTGITSGLLILTVPIFTFTLLVIFIWELFLERNKVKRLLVIFFIAFALIGLWSIRNYYVFNSFVFVSTNGGFNLLLGNSKNTEPNSGVNIDISQYYTGIKGLNEAELDRYYRDKAIEYLLNNKEHSIFMYFQKVLNYFNFENELYTKSESSNFKNLIMLISYGFLLLILLIRFILIKKVRMTDLEKLILIIYFSNAFLTAIFFTRIRLRVPFDILLVIALSVFLFNLGRSFKNSQIAR